MYSYTAQLCPPSGVDPRIGRIEVMLVAPDERGHAGDQKTPQVLIPHLRDVTEPLLAAAGVVERREAEPSRELTALLARKPVRLVTVAMANRAARVIWAIMVRGEVYRMPVAQHGGLRTSLAISAVPREGGCEDHVK